MMRKLALMTAFIFSLNTLRAQDEPPQIGCETVPIDSATMFSFPWFGNNQYLIDYVDSIYSIQGKPTSISNSEFYIPVHAWIHLPNLFASSNISKSTVERYINNVNNIMENTGSLIRFYLVCEPFLVANSAYTYLTSSNTNSMFDDYYLENGMNIHFVVDGDAHRGRFPWQSHLQPYACYIVTRNDNSTWYINNTSRSLVHEIGHAFGLIHTHEGSRGGQTFNRACSNCYQEAVDRTKTQSVLCFSTMGKKTCSVNGDLLCDTDADPGQLDGFNNSLNLPDCSYSPIPHGGIYLQDNWGDSWLQSPLDNAIENIMSYNHQTDCRSQLTTMQHGVELNYMISRNPGSLIFNHTTFFHNPAVDLYENDNYKENATTIASGDCQEHSFHRVPLPNGDMSASCDYDWLSFRPTNSGYYWLTTSGISGMENADTKITLYAADGATIIQTNDNISSSNRFSRIIRTFNANQQYYIKLEKSDYFYRDDYYQVCISQFHFPTPDELQPLDGRFVLAPNPATSSVRVVGSEDNQISAIFVYDLTGTKKYEVIFNENSVTSHTINISSYLQGNYIVHIFDGLEWYGGTLQKL